MIKFIKKLFTQWFGKKEEPVIEKVEKPRHCYIHSRFKKSCPACREIIK